MRALTWARRLGAVAALALAACNGVLGIDSAVTDPNALGSAAGAAGSGNSSDITCPSFCALVAKNCTGNAQQYPDIESCVNMCAAFEPGAIADLTKNTLQCRYNNAKLAGDEPAKQVAYCNAAGPLGGKVCGTAPCQAFCDLVANFCKAPPPYAGPAACLLECSKYPILLDLGVSDFVAGDMKDTLNCRDYHLQVAVKNPTVHCAHTALMSATCSN